MFLILHMKKARGPIKDLFDKDLRWASKCFFSHNSQWFPMQCVENISENKYYN